MQAAKEQPEAGYPHLGACSAHSGCDSPHSARPCARSSPPCPPCMPLWSQEPGHTQQDCLPGHLRLRKPRVAMPRHVELRRPGNRLLGTWPALRAAHLAWASIAACFLALPAVFHTTTSSSSVSSVVCSQSGSSTLPSTPAAAHLVSQAAHALCHRCGGLWCHSQAMATRWSAPAVARGAHPR